MSTVLAMPLAGPRLQRSTWRERYGRWHGYIRLRGDPALPNGRRGRVTLYQRGEDVQEDGRHTYILSWCAHGRRHKQRVVGDIYDAVRRADEINTAIKDNNTGTPPSRLSVEELVARFIDGLQRRADAGEISPKTPVRYWGALRHLVAFSRTCVQPRTNRSGWVPTRDFALQFKTYLQGARVSSNGHPRSPRRSIAGKGIDFILSASRALVRWAAREGYLPAVASDAFARSGRQRMAMPALTTAPIQSDEVVALIHQADVYQLVLFSFHIFHGARVAEPAWLMLEFLDRAGSWVDYRCIDELGYRTKGGTNKRLPLPAPMMQALALLTADRADGPILRKRKTIEREARRAGRQHPLRKLIKTVEGQSPANWSQRVQAGLAALKEAGGINGDDIRREFAHLVRQAGLRDDLRPKALRHHFATTLERADIPYYTRKYLLGHAVSARGRHADDPTAVYTHLDPDFIRAGYQRLLDGPLSIVAEAFAKRLAELRNQDPGV